MGVKFDGFVVSWCRGFVQTTVILILILILILISIRLPISLSFSVPSASSRLSADTTRLHPC
jgi:hypothetical protein